MKAPPPRRPFDSQGMAHYQLSGVNDFFQDSFFRTLPDAVHPTNPGHLVLCFQLLVDAFCLGHPGNHKIHSLDTGGFRFHKVVVQFAGEDQLLIEPGAMFLQIRFTHPAVVTDALMGSVREIQIGEVVVTMQCIMDTIF